MNILIYDTYMHLYHNIYIYIYIYNTFNVTLYTSLLCII